MQTRNVPYKIINSVLWLVPQQW